MTDRTRKYKPLLELASASAVVISLVFVGIEVRQGSAETALNTRATQVSAYQDLITQISEMNLLAITDPEWGILQTQIGRAPESVTDEVERMKYDMYFFLLLRHGDMAYYQFQNGMMNEERLRSAMGPVRQLRSPLGREFWESNRAIFVPSYREYVDSLLAAR